MRSKRSPRKMMAFAALVCGTLTVAATTSVQHVTRKFEGPVMPGVVADAERRTLVARRQYGRLTAVELATGHQRWTVEGALHPVGRIDDVVLVWRPDVGGPNVVALETRDLTTGEVRGPALGDIVLPDWATTTPRPGMSLEIILGISRRGLPAVLWSAESAYRGGARPPVSNTLVPPPRGAPMRDGPPTTRGLPTAETRVAKGALEIDFATGALAEISFSQARRIVPGAPAAGVGAGESAQYSDGFSWRTDPMVMLDGSATLNRTTHSGLDTLTLSVTKPGSKSAGSAKWLVQGRSLLAQRSGDGGYLLVHESVVPGPHETLVWQVFALPSGERIARLPYLDGSQAEVIAHGVLVALVERRSKITFGQVAQRRDYALVALDLKTGEEIWRVALEGTVEDLPKP